MRQHTYVLSPTVFPKLQIFCATVYRNMQVSLRELSLLSLQMRRLRRISSYCLQPANGRLEKIQSHTLLEDT